LSRDPKRIISADYGALTALEGLKETWNRELLDQWVICNAQGECFSKCCPGFYHRDSTKIWIIGRFLHPKKHKNAISAEIRCTNSNNNGHVHFERHVNRRTGVREYTTLFHCRDIVYDEVRRAMCPQYGLKPGEYIPVGDRTKLLLSSPLGKIMTETLKESLDRLKRIQEPWMSNNVRVESSKYSTACPCSLTIGGRYQMPQGGRASNSQSASIGYKPAYVGKWVGWRVGGSNNGF